MTSVTERWQRYLADPSTDADDVADLFGDPSAPPAAELLAPLPNGAAVAARIDHLRSACLWNGWYFSPDPAAALPRAEQERLARAQLDAMGDWLARHDQADLAAAAAALPIEFTNDRPDGWVHLAFDAIGDGFRDAGFAWDDRYLGLKEAVYAMTTIPWVTFHVLNPAVGLDADFQPGHDLWLGGGFLLLRDEAAYVLPA